MVNAFSTALRLLTRFPVRTEECRDTRLILVMFPVVGLVLGVMLWMAAAFLAYASNRLAAAFICAMLLPPLYWWVTEGRNVSGIIWCAGNWRQGETDADTEARYRPYWVIVAVQVVFLCRVGATGILVYNNHALWLVAGPILALAAHAELLGNAVQPQEQRPGVGWHWILATVCCVLAGGVLHGLPAGILAPVLAWVAVQFLARHVEFNCGVLNEAGHGAIREVIELITLVVGIISFAAPMGG